MKSVRPFSDKRRRTYLRLLSEIQHALNGALTEEHADRGLTRAQMAAILGWDRASVTKLLSGTRNMRLETLADLAYALDRPIRVTLPSRTRATNASPKPPAVDDAGGVDVIELWKTNGAPRTDAWTPQREDMVLAE